MFWPMMMISMLGGLLWEDEELKASFSDIANLRPAMLCENLSQNNKINT